MKRHVWKGKLLGWRFGVGKGEFLNIFMAQNAQHGYVIRKKEKKKKDLLLVEIATGQILHCNFWAG